MLQKILLWRGSTEIVALKSDRCSAISCFSNFFRKKPKQWNYTAERAEIFTLILDEKKL